ncbi:Vesicular glutamate transporter 1 [Pseudolycoriella hygida]|uniref:Sialin n=1 Tax=Pseudolycoriella hygida TaxID=35572 RepID=A0A9Q0S2K9_9DIPT|nr:Vesicular glutamate transporter 1 [Pseudolycoriella hygida]
MCQIETSTNGNRSVDQEKEPLTWMFWRKRRYIVAMMVHVGFLSSYTMRVNLSVAIVEMTKTRSFHNGDGTAFNERELYFDWSVQDRGIILSSFFWGYICTQLAGGFLSKKFGGKWVLGLGIGLTAILTLLIPWLVRTVTTMIVIRVLQGMCLGVTFPSTHNVWLYWAPIPERTRMASIGVAGMLVGTVIGLPISAFLATALGWESIFYVFGGFGVLWLIAWIIVVPSTPAQDRRISKDELEYIQRNAGASNEKSLNVPWKSFLTSKPIYAITASHTTDTWGTYTMLTQMPSFLSDALNYDLESSGLLSAAPYLLMSFCIPLSGAFADILQNKNLLTTTQVRKYFNCGAFLIQMVCMLMAGFIVHRVWSVVFIVIAVGIGGFALTSYSTNPLDIAPAYASVILGFSNTFATVPGIISPALTGYLVQNQTVDEWRIVFYIAASVYVFGTTVYWFWCSGEVQPWALTKNRRISEETKKDEISSEGVHI